LELRWIWQHKAYPQFHYDKEKLTALIGEIEYLRGVVDGYSKLFSKDDISLNREPLGLEQMMIWK